MALRRALLSTLLLACLPLSFARSEDEYASLSPESIAQLQLLRDEHFDSTSVAFYPIPVFVLWVVYYLAVKAAETALAKYTHGYSKMSFRDQRTSVMYILNIFFTLAALAVQMGSSGFFVSEYTVLNVSCVRVATAIITSLYLFELTYRTSMRAQMLVHHFVTVFVIMFVIACIEKTRDPSIMLTGNMWLFQATTEQGIFLGLLLYRFRYRPSIVCRVLRFGALQALLVKAVFSVYVLVWWGLKQARHSDPLEIIFSVILVITMLLLMGTQVYGTWIIFKLAATYRRKYRDSILVSPVSGKDTSSGDVELGEPSLPRDNTDATARLVSVPSQTSDLASKTDSPITSVDQHSPSSSDGGSWGSNGSTELTMSVAELEKKHYLEIEDIDHSVMGPKEGALVVPNAVQVDLEDVPSPQAPVQDGEEKVDDVAAIPCAVKVIATEPDPRLLSAGLRLQTTQDKPTSPIATTQVAVEATYSSSPILETTAALPTEGQTLKSNEVVPESEPAGLTTADELKTPAPQTEESRSESSTALGGEDNVTACAVVSEAAVGSDALSDAEEDDDNLFIDAEEKKDEVRDVL